MVPLCPWSGWAEAMTVRRLVDAIRGLLGATGDGPYECRACGTRLSVQYHSCPECGSYRVERASWLSN